MYSETIKLKVNTLFNDLRQRVLTIVAESYSSEEAVKNATRTISSELTTRSKSILSDMLFDLSDSLMDSEFFRDDLARQNRFYEINLRQEILDSYQFAPDATVDYKEASGRIQALKVGGATLAVGGIAEIGAVLIAGLSLSTLIPIPIGALIVASIGAALAEYFALAPAHNKKALTRALSDYLLRAEKQFFGWFDEVEGYYNRRVEEIKQTL